MAVNADQFTCEGCGGTYGKEWTDEEALEESVGLFGDLPADDLAVVCEDCFKAMGFG